MSPLASLLLNSKNKYYNINEKFIMLFEQTEDFRFFIEDMQLFHKLVQYVTRMPEGLKDRFFSEFYNKFEKSNQDTVLTKVSKYVVQIAQGESQEVIDGTYEELLEELK